MVSNSIGSLISNKTGAFQKEERDHGRMNESFDELINRILDGLEVEKDQGDRQL